MASVLRRVARAWSVATILLVVGFIVGEGVHPSQMAPHEKLGVFFFPLGICVGMVVAWRRELLGALITVGSLAAFYAISVAATGRFPHGWAWEAFAAPGFLFLASWFLSRNPAESNTDAGGHEPPRRPR